jgi:hypothetical protein
MPSRPPFTGTFHETPYGLRISEDCRSLVEDAEEVATMRTMLGLFAKERTPAEIAAELNRSGHRRRNGSEWTAVAVFEMHPRWIEAGASLYKNG